MDGAIKALCNRLVVVELNNRTSRDLAEQCVKVGGRLSKYWSINQGAAMYLPKGNGHLGLGLLRWSLRFMTLTRVEVKLEPGDGLWKGSSVCVWMWVFVSGSSW